ncbi:RpiB/LacA/LacB family sugar-phosphate isomerase, partial [Patescibacteria group bacterium]|nr:RpiB/LacA/LacB family sugar-phosphate isomerase [Patescibacteria group bacterium]
MKIYLAADHGGYELKNSIAQHLQAKGIEVQDFGPHQLVPDDDYPDYVIPAMEQVQQAKTAAIITCRNGVGVSVLANKF